MVSDVAGIGFRLFCRHQFWYWVKSDLQALMVFLAKALRFFECLLSSWSGQVLETEDVAFLDSAMRSKGHNMASLRADAVMRSIKELEVIDRLIERQFTNMRLLMQSYESVRFAPQLLKKMSLEIEQLEQRVQQTDEDQLREVSRQ